MRIREHRDQASENPTLTQELGQMLTAGEGKSFFAESVDTGEPPMSLYSGTIGCNWTQGVRRYTSEARIGMCWGRGVHGELEGEMGVHRMSHFILYMYKIPMSKRCL